MLELQEKSKSELNEVILFLQNNPRINIEIDGHTDSLGNDAYNLRLSLDRAKSVGTFLKDAGISIQRVKEVGYASKKLVASPNYFGGNAVVSLSLPAELTNVTANLVITATGVREARGTVAKGVWTAPLNTLGSGGTIHANNAVVVLEFIAANADGSRKTIRFFSITVIAVTLDLINALILRLPFKAAYLICNKFRSIIK